MNDLKTLTLKNVDGYVLIKRNRDGVTIGGMTKQGVVLVSDENMDDMTDDELLELMTIRQ